MGTKEGVHFSYKITAIANSSTVVLFGTMPEIASKHRYGAKIIIFIDHNFCALLTFFCHDATKHCTPHVHNTHKPYHLSIQNKTRSLPEIIVSLRLSITQTDLINVVLGLWHRYQFGIINSTS